MKRTRLKPGKPLRRTKPLKQSGMRRGRSQRSATSGGHLFYREVDDNYRNWIRSQRCILLGHRFESAAGYLVGGLHFCEPIEVQCCHVKSRGSGAPDKANCVAMCAMQHAYQHQVGVRSFQTRWGVDLKAEAAKLYARYQAEVGAAAPGRPA